MGSKGHWIAALSPATCGPRFPDLLCSENAGMRILPHKTPPPAAGKTSHPMTFNHCVLWLQKQIPSCLQHQFSCITMRCPSFPDHPVSRRYSSPPCSQPPLIWPHLPHFWSPKPFYPNLLPVIRKLLSFLTSSTNISFRFLLKFNLAPENTAFSGALQGKDLLLFFLVTL